MRIPPVVAALLALHAGVTSPALAASQTDRLGVSAIVEGACGITVPRLMAQLRSLRSSRTLACAALTTGVAPPPQPVVSLGWDAEMESDVLLVEF